MKPIWKRILLAIVAVSVSLGAACKKAENSGTEAGAAAGGSSMMTAPAASGPAAAVGASN